MKWLVCIIGSLRGGRWAVDSLKKYVLGPLGADLAVLQGYGEMNYPGATHIWRVKEYSNWERILNVTLPTDWRRKVRPIPNLWGPVDNLPGSGAITFALRRVLLKYLDAMTDPIYDIVLLTRSDHVYGCAHPLINVSVAEVCVMEGQNWNGVNDRHTVFRYEDRARVLDVHRWLVNNASGVVAINNPETALKAYYAAGGLTVRSFKRVAFTYKEARDQTRWGVIRHRPCGTGHSKYPQEHAMVVRTCKRDPCRDMRRTRRGS